MFTPSRLQEAIKDWFLHSTGHAIIQAVAGSGKTTTIIWLLSFIMPSLRVLLTSFGKAIVTTLEAKAKQYRNVTAKTLNALGYQAVKRHLGLKWLKVEGNKCLFILCDMYPKGEGGKRDPEYKLYKNLVVKLVSLAKNVGIGCLVPDEPEQWLRLITHYGLSLDSPKANEQRAIEIARDVLRTSTLQASRSIDFDDQLYLAILWDLPLPKFDVILNDETQDTNMIQQEMLRRMLAPNGRLIAVGDSGQAIYGFRGADAEAMGKLAASLNCVELALSVCYRCSKAVINKANEILAIQRCTKDNKPYNPQDWQGEHALIQAREGAPEGKIETLKKYDASTFKSSDVIICRNGAPLVVMAYQFIGKGIGVKILGRELGEKLIQLIEQLEATSIDDLLVKLLDYERREVGRLVDQGREAEAEAVQDRCRSVTVLADNLKESNRSIVGLITAIESLFTNEANGVLTLCTAHRSKGLEYPRAFILDANKYMPSQYATQPWQLEQEYNLMYVATTRAMVDLYYIESDKWDDQADIDAARAKAKAVREERKQAKLGSEGSYTEGMTPNAVADEIEQLEAEPILTASEVTHLDKLRAEYNTDEMT